MSDAPYRASGAREPDAPEPDPRGPWVLQTWVSRRECPDCSVPLFAARKEGFRIDACGGCGGAWLDHATAQHAIAERSLVPALLADEASTHAASRASSAAVTRRCPDCRSALLATTVADASVAIDVCAGHGAWFDPHEMRAVIEAMVRRRPPVVDPQVDREIARAEMMGWLRPPASYEPPGLLGSLAGPVDYADAFWEILDEAARTLRWK